MNKYLDGWAGSYPVMAQIEMVVNQSDAHFVGKTGKAEEAWSDEVHDVNVKITCLSCTRFRNLVRAVEGLR